ncbi:MAG TPA: LLM class flavin-dependent oxidoreductase [Chloroflexota bacterium]|jgi:natural product biosynthesis luciferase-like monooxygenase protein|nr:LLM class flavin-dependent oxidoreductase [Chloroflexota bacterium]
MRFGLNFFPSFRPSDLSTAEYYHQVLTLCERADALGYSSVKAVEHYFHDYGGHTPSPLVLLAAVAARTRRLRLITGAAIPAFNHPIKLAAEMAMLDNLSGGRFDAGFGRAFIPEEFDAFGVALDDSRARFEEGIAVIKRLWTEPRVTHAGRFHRFRDVHLLPRPVQRPHPPIWIAAVLSEDSFRWAGEQGYHLMIVPFAGSLERTAAFVRTYREAWARAGHPPGAEQVQMSFHCYLAETHAAAVEGFQRPAARYIEVFSEAVSSWVGRASGAYQGYDRMVAAVRAMTPQQFIEGGVAFVGTPGEVIEQVRRVRETFGEVEPSMQINFGGLPLVEAQRTLELFAREVMPAFATPTAAPARP